MEAQPFTTNPTPNTVSVPPRRSGSTIAYFFVFLFMISMIILGYQNYQLRTALHIPVKTSPSLLLPTPSQQPPSIPSPSLLQTADQQQWKRTEISHYFSYEYPVGWHVTYQSGSSNGLASEIMILMDEKPIFMTPGDGPVGAFQISIKSDLSNPDEVFRNDQENFKQLITKIESGTIYHTLGTVYHYSGITKEGMYGGAALEKYYLTFPTIDNDAKNRRLVSAERMFNDHPEHAAILHHVIMSIEKL